MARGWESKSVEDQVAATETLSNSQKKRLSAEDADRQRKRELLVAARAQTLEQLRGSSNTRYCRMLQDSLRAINAQIASLSPED
jgi:hypothetical protein